MVWTPSLDVDIGDYTKASDYDLLADNPEYLQVLADVQHNFDVSTGTGYHKAITQLITDAAGATVKDLLTSEWDPVSGAAAANQGIRWLAKMPDSANNQDIYAALRTISDTVTSTSEEGRVVLALMAAGTLTDQIEILKNAVRPTTDSALNLGSASQRLLGVFTDTLGDSGQQLALNSSSVRAANVPSFGVNNSATNSNQTGDGTDYVVPWDTEVWDQGAGFASNTFTAQVTGRYRFSTLVGLIGVGSAHTLGQVYIETSNRNYICEFNPYATVSGAGGTAATYPLSVEADMDAGDTAKVRVWVTNGTKVVGVTASGGSRWFSGYMLH